MPPSRTSRINEKVLAIPLGPLGLIREGSRYPSLTLRTGSPAARTLRKRSEPHKQAARVRRER